MARIELKNVKKSFGAVDVIKGVDLTVEEGEFMVFVGPSGCGKSTLLRLISGLETITSGELFFDGERMNDVLPSRRGIAMVFQSYALYPHMTVKQNMEFGMKLAGSSKAEVEMRVNEAAEMLQIGQLLDRLPRQLSGGQRQRVAIGRAITRDPRVFLFDEPLSNLDAALRVTMRLEIARLHHDMEKVTMVYVTHDQVEAMTLADRICVLRDGQVMQVGTPEELYERPNSTFVAEFIGSPKMNFLDGHLAARHGAHVIGIRAEHLDVMEDGLGDWSGPVVHTENLGSDNYIFVDIGTAEPVIARLGGESRVRLRTRVSLRPHEGRLHRFDAEGRPIT